MRFWVRHHDLILAFYGGWLILLTTFSIAGWPWQW